MKKLTILMSVLMLALTSVFAQDPASVTLSKHGAQPEQVVSYFVGESTTANFYDSADLTLTGDVDKTKLKVVVKGDEVYQVRFNDDTTQVKLYCPIYADKDTSYKDTVIVWEEGRPLVADSIFFSFKVTGKTRPVITVTDASVFALGEVTLEAAENSIAKASAVALVPDGTIEVEKSGANAENFAVEIKNGELSVVFTADVAGNYVANAKLTATDAIPVDVALSATVATPAPELSVLPAKWEENLTLKGGKAEAQKSFSIIGSYLLGKVKKEIQGGLSSKFSWDDANQIVKFSAEEVGTFEDTLLVSTPKVEPVKIPLKVVVNRPVITVNATSYDFGEVSLEDAILGAKKFETGVSVDPKEALSAASDNAAFMPEIKDNKLIVVFQAESAAEYNGKITITAEDAEPVEVTLTAKVNMPKPVLNVTPAEWKETVELKDGKAEAERQISISAVFTLSYPKVELQSGANFVWDADNSKVKFAATAEGTYKDTLVVSATGAETKKVALEIEVKKGGDTPVVPVAVESVSLDKESAELEVGKTLQLTATVLPANADNKKVSWSSSDDKVATVANGLVTAVAKGTATITVTTEDGAKTATCAITVKEGEVPPTPGDCNDYAYTFTEKMDKSAQLGAYNWTLTIPSDAYIGFDTNNGKGAQFGSGSKPAKNVSLKTSDVADCPIKNVVVNASMGKDGDGQLAVYIGETQIGQTISLDVAPTDYTFENTTGAKGDLDIRLTNTVKAMYILSIAVNMNGATPPAPVAVESVSLDKESAELEVGKTLQLTATVLPANADNKKVSWSSSDDKVATVANGLVTAVAKGTATITVTTEDGAKTATCAITVKEGEVPPTPPTEGGWVSDPSKLKAGDKITIVNFDGTFAMSTEQVTVENSKIYRGATAFDEKNISTSVEQVELVASGNNFKLKVNGGFLYFDDAWTKNWLGTNENGSDYKFETSGDTIFIVDAKNDRVILYNAPETGDPRFSEYKKTSSVRATGAVKLFLLGEVEQKATTKLTIDPKTAEVAVGATVKLNVERDGNDELVWKSMDETIATVANGVVTGVAEGVVKIAATANNISDTCVVTVVKAADIPTKTIAEFIAAKGGKCYLTGVVSNIKTYDDGTYNKYGNFDLTDASGKIYVYGLLSATGEKQKFQELGVDEGDTLTVIAETYQLYKETDEVVDAIFVEVKKAGEVPPQPGELLDVDYGMGLYIVDELGPFWQFAAGKLPADPEAEDLDYPIILFQFENEDATHIAGEFEIFYGILYTSDNDSIEVEYGTVEITCIEEGANGQAPYYHVRVTFTDEQGNVIGVYEFETEVYAYDAETEQEIELEDKASQGIENVSAFEIDFNAPMYNIQGMQVGRGTQGILIQNGHKFIIAK